MPFVFDDRLDQTFLESLYGDDIDYARDVFEEFLANTKIEFEGIKKDFRENDLKGLRQKLHKIKPSFSFVGLPGMTAKTETIITGCDKSSTTLEMENGCTTLFQEIEISFSVIEKELTRMKNYA